jgi:hypothetical protein
LSHVKTGRWFGMQPPSTQTRPDGQVFPVPQGLTQRSWTQVVLPWHWFPPSVHGVGFCVQTPFERSQPKPVGQGFEAEQDGVQTPCTHCWPPGHCVASEHWSAGAVHWPERHFAPAVAAQSASL